MLKHCFLRSSPITQRTVWDSIWAYTCRMTDLTSSNNTVGFSDFCMNRKRMRYLLANGDTKLIALLWNDIMPMPHFTKLTGCDGIALNCFDAKNSNSQTTSTISFTCTVGFVPKYLLILGLKDQIIRQIIAKNFLVSRCVVFKLNRNVSTRPSFAKRSALPVQHLQ